MRSEKHFEKLNEIMKKYAQEDVIVAFSGGVDSSLLLSLACEYSKGTVYAVTLHTMLHPMGELEEARKIAHQMGAEHIVITVDELEEADILMNPKDRCYRCKKCLFEKILDKAKELAVHTIIEGTNEEDLHVYRPGIQAVRELGIRSPLAEAGMTKVAIRTMAKDRNIETFKKPSTPCLATRFPYNTKLSYEKMRMVEKGEQYIKEFGFYNVRLRVHQDLVRIEVDDNQLNKVIQHRTEIISQMKKIGFQYITIDLEGFRSGCYDTKRRIDD